MWNLQDYVKFRYLYGWVSNLLISCLWCSCVLVNSFLQSISIKNNGLQSQYLLIWQIRELIRIWIELYTEWVLGLIYSFVRENHICESFHTIGVKTSGSIRSLRDEYHSCGKFHHQGVNVNATDLFTISYTLWQN